MNVMINCLKLNDYNETQCGNEVRDFTKCFKEYKVGFSCIFFVFKYIKFILFLILGIC